MLIIDKKTKADLLNKAQEIAKRAYAPYSRFHVGCAILLEDGRVIEGVNIENASYPVALCAERSAMARVVTEGLQDTVKALAVVTSATPPGSPCGMCRQFLSEFLPQDAPILLGNTQGECRETTMGDLLPMPFLKQALGTLKNQ